MQQLGEQEKPEPENGAEGEQPRSPRDPRDPRTAQPDDPGSVGPSRDGNLPPWVANLPPQLRDSVVSGRYESVPPEFRELVKRYHQRLLRETGRQAGSGN